MINSVFDNLIEQKTSTKGYETVIFRSFKGIKTPLKEKSIEGLLEKCRHVKALTISLMNDLPKEPRQQFDLIAKTILDNNKAKMTVINLKSLSDFVKTPISEELVASLAKSNHTSLKELDLGYNRALWQHKIMGSQLLGFVLA